MGIVPTYDQDHPPLDWERIGGYVKDARIAKRLWADGSRSTAPTVICHTVPFSGDPNRREENMVVRFRIGGRFFWRFYTGIRQESGTISGMRVVSPWRTSGEHGQRGEPGRSWRSSKNRN